MTSTHAKPDPQGKYLYTLSLAALGVVFGDIGTSPLYALRESFHASHNIAANAANVLGVLSLIFWSLIIVITIKYLVFVLRADNRGEGGILALTSLVVPSRSLKLGEKTWYLTMLGIFGTALLYGDGMITPAISVLSAVEGLEVATPFFRPYIIPITVVILIALFSVQRHGTARVGRIFGPVTLLWFTVLAVLGIWNIAQQPQVLAAVNPMHGARFFQQNGFFGFAVLGSVFLVITGGEALYADMGHFGRKPIRIAWLYLVFPALLLNYFGQGALVLRHPEAVHNPFFNMAPQWALYPLVGLATAATVIASQALISGVFSLTRQAVQLGYSPRMDIEHTSSIEIGQIYVPFVNWGLMIACIGLVLGFQSSSRLAAAYGVGVTTDMVITTLLFTAYLRKCLKWSLPAVAAIAVTFLTVDLAFWGANLLKIPHGGWFPLVVAAVLFTFLTTWKRGRYILASRLKATSKTIPYVLKLVEQEKPVRVPGTAIFMSGNPNGVPYSLLHNMRHNHVLHERVILLTVTTEEVPHIEEKERLQIEKVAGGFWRVIARYGFMEDPEIDTILRLAEAQGLRFDMEDTTFFLGREHLLATPRPGMAIWREKLFAWMSKNARGATAFFRLPPERVVEVGTQVEL